MNARDCLEDEYLWIQLQQLDCIWIMSRTNVSWRGVDQVKWESYWVTNRLKLSAWTTPQINGSCRGVDWVVSETGSRYKPIEVIQLPSLLTMRGALGKILWKRGSWWVKDWGFVESFFILWYVCVYNRSLGWVVWPNYEVVEFLNRSGTTAALDSVTILMFPFLLLLVLPHPLLYAIL